MIKNKNKDCVTMENGKILQKETLCALKIVRPTVK